MKFKEYKGLDLAGLASDVLAEWDSDDTFHKSISTREGHPTFVFYEGPPSANGMPGIHHVMARTIKDVFCRYKTQQGYLVHRKAGWDTHGLPVELGVEKKLGITKEDIGKTISIEEYNRTCREAVMEFKGVWEKLTRQMGYWVNMDDPYITYDNKYIESLWWLLKQLYEKGLLYKGYTIQPYSPAAGTGLSTHELNQPGCYRDVKDTTVVAQFRIRNPKAEMTGWGTPYFLAWTTTPWTLPSNTALCVGPRIDYVAVRTYNPYTGEKQTVVLAKALLHAHFNRKAEGLALDAYKPGDKLVPYEVVAEYKGPELVGMEYEQLLPWVKPVEVDEQGEWHDASAKAFRVIPGDYVTTEDGTGIVHIAPTFGADDANVARAAGIPSLFMLNRKGETRPMVDLTGKFYLLDELDERFVRECVDVEAYREYEGRWVKNAYDPQFTVDGRYDEKAVIRTDPAAGSQVAAGTTVVIYVSRPQVATTTKVPSLIGMSVDDARTLLVQRKLGLGSQTEQYSDQPVGSIISQNPGEGASAKLNTRVSVVVSAGPEPAPEPEAPSESTDGSGGWWGGLFGGSSSSSESTGDSSASSTGGGLSDWWTSWLG